MTARRITFFVLACVVIVILIAGTHWLVKHFQQPSLAQQANAPGTPLPGSGPVTIILSPHFDDAVLSVGGLLARHDRPALVATFFTGAPTVSTTTSWDVASGFTNSTVAINVRVVENRTALRQLQAVPENYGYFDNQYGHGIPDDQLESALAQDIQALLVAHAGREIFIYGPAEFGSDITHPDHQILHDAFVDVIRGFPAPTVHFFFYEDYPYISRFSKTSFISLKKYIQNHDELSLNEIDIPLSKAQVSAKISALKTFSSQIEAFAQQGIDIVTDSQTFTSTRCATQACEAVYEVGPTSTP